MGNILLLVIDSVGIGALPDADRYGDEGAATLQHILRSISDVSLPNMEKLGLGKIEPLHGVRSDIDTYGIYGKLSSMTIGKDTTAGHWELMGVILKEGLKTFPKGFPSEIMDIFKKETGYDYIGNIAASGTEIIKELGEEHLKTGKLIVYTSSDSVFQIAAHEGIISIEELYRICRITRNICDKYNISRVIARPFVEEKGLFVRTRNRKDFSLKPPGKTVLNLLQDAEINILGIGKIDDIFASCGITHNIPVKGNPACIAASIEALKSYSNSFIFTNLVDFDMLYGHRRDPKGYYKCLKEFDTALPMIINALQDDDLLIITADHGNDPTFKGTDHTREYVPIMIYQKSFKTSKNLGIRKTFADVGKTIAHYFNVDGPDSGESFLNTIME